MDLVTPGIGLIFWQTITFLLVLIVLGKFVWKPIMSALKERESAIEEALSAAEKAREEMENLQAENEKLIREAQLERDKMLKEAKEASNRMIEESKEKASKEGAKIVADARQAINSEKNAAMKELQDEAANLSVQIAEKILRKELKSDASKKELIADYMKETKLN